MRKWEWDGKIPFRGNGVLCEDVGAGEGRWASLVVVIIYVIHISSETGLVRIKGLKLIIRLKWIGN